jgi:exopolyphosphatase/guanosine-5'-triphosphate,3'-diphosphate pyrophosphatase
LAVLLNRSRSSLELPEIKVEVGESSIRLEFPQGWLDDNPLTITDLEREKDYLEQVGYDLTYS